MASSLISLHLPKPSKLSSLPRASISPSTTTQSPPQTLDQKFGRKGIKFTESGDDVPTVELTVRNGSSLKLRIPDGLVTSYKPKVYWKDEAFEEVLHTVPGGLDSGFPLKGGVSLVLNVMDGSPSPPWSASEWVVKGVDSDSIDSVQVELSCTNGDGSLEITYIISLFALSMATAAVVRNKGLEAVKLTSAMLSHLKFKSRRGSAIQGLRGCSYCAHPPLSSKFGILSQEDAMEPEPPGGWSSFLGSVFNSTENQKADKPETWTSEEQMYTMLRGKLSRVYTAPPMERLKRVYYTPPSKYETIDQGSGLGFRVIRMGYDDIYLCSPGSYSQKYGKDYFICTGPASMLVPVVLDPGEVWRGAQVIEHDNL